VIKGLGGRMIRAARLDGSLYDEIKTDRRAPVQAALIVILSALAAGIGVVVQTGVGDFFLKTLQALLEWYICAFFTCVAGMRMFQEPQTRTDVGGAVRMISFASAPGMIRLLAIIPGVGGYVLGAASVWMLGATVVAVKKTLDYTTTGRAVGVSVIGWVAQWLVMGILLSLRDPVSGT